MAAPIPPASGPQITFGPSTPNSREIPAGVFRICIITSRSYETCLFEVIFWRPPTFVVFDYVTKLLTCMFLDSKCSIQSYFDVFLLEHPWQRQFPVLVPRRYDVMPSDYVMILAPARLWRHTFRSVFSCSFLPKEFICFVFTTWLHVCEQHSHIVWMVPCQVNRCFIIQYIRFNIKRITQLLN